MQDVYRRRISGLLARLVPENPADITPVYSSFALPHQYNPKLGFAEALVAVFATLARILTSCAIFAVWGAMSLLAWSHMSAHAWRFVVLVPMLLALPAALFPPMLAIAAIERRLRPRRP